MMRNGTKWWILLLAAVILTACAPAETMPEPTTPAPDLEPAPGATSTLVDGVAPVEETESPLPSPTATQAAEVARPTATPLPTLELMPAYPPKLAPTQEMPPMPDNPPAPSPDDPHQLALIDRAKTDLAQRTGIDKDEIVLVEFRLMTWSDASLGCPQPGMAYAQVMVDGYLIMLRAGLGIYNYHGGGYPDRGPFLCEGGIGTKIIVPPPSASVDQ